MAITIPKMILVPILWFLQFSNLHFSYEIRVFTDPFWVCKVSQIKGPTCPFQKASTLDYSIKKNQALNCGKKIDFLRLPQFFILFNKLSLNFLGKAEIKKLFPVFGAFLRNALISHF